MSKLNQFCLRISHYAVKWTALLCTYFFFSNLDCHSLWSGCRSAVQVMDALFLSTPSASRNSCHSHTSLSKEFQACYECGKSTVMQGCEHGSGFSWPITAGSEMMCPSQLPGGPVWDYCCMYLHFNLIGKTLQVWVWSGCVYVCVFCLFVACRQLSPSLWRLTIPASHLSWNRQLLHSLCLFFKHRNTYTLLDPSPSYLSQSLWGIHVVVLLSSKLVALVSLMPTWPPEGPYKSQASEVCGECWQIPTHTLTRPSSSPDLEW